jgi:hypothetical protein
MVYRLIDTIKVATAKTVSQIIYPDSPNPHSKTVQVQKQLNTLVGLGKIKRGKGFYSTLDYEGEFKEHDQEITRCIAELLKLNYPISIYRERSLRGGIRPDIIGLIGKEGKALCFIVEVCISEEDSYLEKKLIFWKHHNPLEEVFGFNIPHFSLVVHGKTHPEMLDFENFIKLIRS